MCREVVYHLIVDHWATILTCPSREQCLHKRGSALNYGGNAFRICRVNHEYIARSQSSEPSQLLRLLKWSSESEGLSQLRERDDVFFYSRWTVCCWDWTVCCWDFMTRHYCTATLESWARQTGRRGECAWSCDLLCHPKSSTGEHIDITLFFSIASMKFLGIDNGDHFSQQKGWQVFVIRLHTVQAYDVALILTLAIAVHIL